MKPKEIPKRPPLAGAAIRVHRLKCWPPFFGDVASGRKTFEVRQDDRDFQEGDSLELAEWDPATQQFTGRMVRRRVTYILDLTPPPIDLRGWIAMGLEPEE